MEVASDLGMYPAADAPVVDAAVTAAPAWISERLPPRFEFIKRTLDVVVAVVLLLILVPVLVLCALAVRLDTPGPILFRQQRIGRYGRPFTMLKFRSMYDGVDQAIHRSYATSFILGTAARQPAGKRTPSMLYKLTQDARITTVGRWLRLTSLDELPQLWNVLRGDMSLVGPRPPLDYEVAHYQPRHKRRLAVRPGITGLWQVRGRSSVSFEEMIDMDLEYIDRQSILLELRILVMTLPAILARRGAR
jgi:lipopolysaccharide/colanic/teichoic acid biosynthesis glycosyltransferase